MNLLPQPPSSGDMPGLDVEQILSYAAQVSHEQASTWEIHAQRKTVASMRARLRGLDV